MLPAGGCTTAGRAFKSAAVGVAPGTQPLSQAFIFFWVRYRKDEGAGRWPLLRLHGDSPVMQDVERGDIVWAFTRGRDGPHVIVARLRVTQVGPTPESDPERKAGRWFCESNRLGSSGITLFDPDEQTDAEEVIRSLSTSTEGRVLGHTFRGWRAIRPITAEDAEKRERHAGARASSDAGLSGRKPKQQGEAG